MITILDTSKSLNELVDDNSNGLGIIQPIEATVVEELNGIYELNFTVSIDDKRYNEIKIGGIVKCIAGEQEENQLFRIEQISKPKNGVVSIYAPHISYDLNKIVVEPFTSTGASNTCVKMEEHTMGNYDFTITTNISDTTTEFKNEIPRSFRACLGGWEGSILDLFRCEYEWDNTTVKMLSRRGQDTSVRIAYGKNLVDLTQEENISEVYNACLGYAVFNEQTYTGNIQFLTTTNTPRVKIVDFSNEFNEDNQPTTNKLNQLAKDYASRNSINTPEVNLTISFIPLWQTEEYKDIAPLEQVNLGDRIIVDFPKLNVSANARVVKRTWNVLLNRYDEIELGSTKANLSTIIDNSIGAVYQNTLYTQTLVNIAQSTANTANTNSNTAIGTAESALT